jgi:adenylate cyclase class IV
MAKSKNKTKKEVKKEVLDIEKTAKIIEQEEQEKQEKIKKHKFKIYKVENNSFIINIVGYAKRVYFDLPFKELEYLRDNKNSYINKLLTVYYIGDISDVFSVQILPLKSLTDIGDRF